MSRSLVGGLLLLLASACAGAPPPPALVPGEGPDARAAALQARCQPRRSAAMACYDEALLDMLRADGVAATMAVLERLGETDPTVRRDGHGLAHSIGLAALDEPGEVDATFPQCTPAFQSGCYHGVIQSYFGAVVESGGAVDAPVVNALCGDYRGDAGRRWLLFQCAHGMGHGLAMVNDHHLPATLAGCDLITDSWEREGCYGGAFMENVVNATVPHHAIGRPQAGEADEHAGHDMPAVADEHAGHDMPAAADPHAGHAMPAAREPFEPLKRSDPLYPCNVLDARYQASCYQMQTSAILFFNGYDFPAAARACDGAPELHRSGCYQSFGRDVSAFTLQDQQRALRLCSVASAPYRPDCHVGYSKNLVDLTARPDEALSYCRSIPDADGKAACYQGVGEELWVLSGDEGERRRACATAEAGYGEVCLRAAGVGRG